MADHDVDGMALAIVQAPYIRAPAGTDSPTGTGNSGLHQYAVRPWADGRGLHGRRRDAAGRAGEDRSRRVAARHLSGLPAAWQSVTVRALLAHASGIADYTRAPSYDPARAYRPEELTALAADSRQPFSRGRRWPPARPTTCCWPGSSKRPEDSRSNSSSGRTSSTASASGIRSSPMSSTASARSRRVERPPAQGFPARPASRQPTERAAAAKGDGRHPGRRSRRAHGQRVDLGVGDGREHLGYRAGRRDPGQGPRPPLDPLLLGDRRRADRSGHGSVALSRAQRADVHRRERQRPVGRSSAASPIPRSWSASPCWPTRKGST